MKSIYLIDNKGRFQGSFKSIRDAQYHALHSRINNYYLKRVETKGA